MSIVRLLQQSKFYLNTFQAEEKLTYLVTVEAALEKMPPMPPSHNQHSKTVSSASVSTKENNPPQIKQKGHAITAKSSNFNLGNQLTILFLIQHITDQ